MTGLVIYMCTMNTHVKTALEKWNARADVLADAKSVDPELDLFAVHRWFQRGRIPGKYWNALANGAKNRGLKVSLHDIADAHAIDARSTKKQDVSQPDQVAS